MKVVSVVGPPPQFIKCAPVSYELRKLVTEALTYDVMYDALLEGGILPERCQQSLLFLSEASSIPLCAEIRRLKCIVQALAEVARAGHNIVFRGLENSSQKSAGLRKR